MQEQLEMGLVWVDTIWDDFLTFIDPVLGIDPSWATVILLFLIWLRLAAVKRYTRATAHHMRSSGLFGGGGS